MYLRRIPWIAIVLIVILRIAIGWQLFYEGLWKTKTLSSPKPWTSVGYLKNSQGPLRSTFRNMTGDPNDMDWLDTKKVENKWKRWQKKFAKHYDLDKSQAARLNTLVNGPPEFRSDNGAIKSLPEGVNLDSIRLSRSLGLKDRKKKPITQAIRFDEKNGRLVVNGKGHLDGKDLARILKMLPKSPEDKKKEILKERKTKLDVGEITQAEFDEEIKLDPEPEDIATFRVQLDKVYKRSLRLSYVEKMKASLGGNADVAGVKNKDGEVQRIGDLQKYRLMIEDYEELLANAKQDFQHDHLKKTWGDLQSQRAALVNPIKALEGEMKEDAAKLVNVKQMQANGKPGEPWTGLRIADTLTILGLTLCGFCLIIGLFTRFSAFMAAIMLFSFYLAMPPLPGLPEAPGPEHSLVVNKNLIEVFALAAIAALPSGYWFGLDKFALAAWRRFRGKSGDTEA